MKQSGGGGCAMLVGLLVLLGVVIAVVEWIAQHAIPIAITGLAALAVFCIATAYIRRRQNTRALRRARASLQVEAARSDIERRLTIAQQFMRLSGEALAASSIDDAPRWNGALDDLLAEAQQLYRSTVDSSALQTPRYDPRDRLDAATLNEAVTALCALLDAGRSAARVPWQQRPEQLRVLRRERTRLLLAQDTVAQRVQQ